MISHHHYIAHCITFQRLQVPHHLDYRFSSYGGNTDPKQSHSLHFHIYLIIIFHKPMLILHYHIEHWNSFPTLRTGTQRDLRIKSYEFPKFLEFFRPRPRDANALVRDAKNLRGWQLNFPKTPLEAFRTSDFDSVKNPGLRIQHSTIF